MAFRRRLKYAALVLLVLIAITLTAVVLVVGPWPTYADSGYISRGYHAANLSRIDAAIDESELTATPGPLQAGWAERDMTPPVGAPLAGYSGRPNEKRSTGVHDPVYARAIVLSDGTDAVALVGLDLLMTTINIAEKVWAQVAAKTPLTKQDIDQWYEWRLLDWFGPNQEAMYADLKDRVLDRLENAGG